MAVRDEIYIGSVENPTISFVDGTVISCDTVTAVTLVGDELSADELNVTVQTTSAQATAIKALTYGTNVFYYHDTKLTGKYFYKSAEQIAANQWKLHATSLIGLYETVPFYGGIYNRVKFPDAIKSVIESNGMDKLELVEEAVPSTYVYGGHGRADQKAYMSGLPVLKDGISWAVQFRYLQMGQHYYQYGNTYTTLLWGVAIFYSNVWRIGVGIKKTRASADADWDDQMTVCAVFGNTYYDVMTADIGDIISAELRFSTDSCKIIINGIENTYSYYNGSTRMEWTRYVSGNDAGGFEIIPIIGYVRKNVSGAGDTESVVTEIKCSVIKFRWQQYYFFPARDALSGGACLWPNDPLLSIYRFPNTHDDSPYVAYYEFPYTIGNALYGYNTYSIDSKYNDGQHPTYDHDISDEDGFFHPTALQKSIYDSLIFDEGLENLYIDGWIKICKKRDAIYQILFATGINLVKNEDGDYMFAWNYASTPEDIDDDDIYIDGTVEYPEKVYRIDLTEHGFHDDSVSEPIEVYNNSEAAGVTRAIIEFNNAPIATNTLSASRITIHAACENAALVSGSGVITGRPYEHSENIRSFVVSNDENATIKSVTDATLVNASNGDDVAERLVSYYSSRKYVKTDIVYSNQRCRGLYRLKDAFGNLVTAYLARMESVSSGIIKAACKFIVGYTPDEENPYTHADVHSSGRGWTIPEWVYEKDDPKIRLVIIGGGSGGSSGYAGANGSRTGLTWANAVSKNGGAAGDAGAGGKILEVTIDLTNKPRDCYIGWTLGEGGEGGEISTSPTGSNAGSDGGDTEVEMYWVGQPHDIYSSADGTRSAKGIYNFFNGKRYGGTPPRKYFRNGGNSNSYTLDSYVWESYKQYDHRIKGSTITDPVTGIEYKSGSDGGNSYAIGGCYGIGGCGGGAAVGQNGSNGEACTATGGTYIDRSGNGGNGANATAVPPDILDVEPESYGYGGIGGYGGGAGGSTGTLGEVMPTLYRYYGTYGTGGYGGKGGKGGDGCVIIYY